MKTTASQAIWKIKSGFTDNDGARRQAYSKTDRQTGRQADRQTGDHKDKRQTIYKTHEVDLICVLLCVVYYNLRKLRYRLNTELDL